MIDTPETDNLARGNHVVPTEWAQQLERERDEWRKCAEMLYEIAEHDGYTQEWASVAEFHRLKEGAK